MGLKNYIGIFGGDKDFFTLNLGQGAYSHDFKLQGVFHMSIFSQGLKDNFPYLHMVGILPLLIVA